MKKLLMGAIILFAATAQADIIRCTFTEPFIAMTYSMAQQRLTVQGADIPTRYYSNTAFQILGPSRFVVGSVSAPRIKLTLNYRGSDGMSDFVYPYTAEVPNYFGAGRSLWGGCQSNYLHRRAGS